MSRVVSKTQKMLNHRSAVNMLTMTTVKATSAIILFLACFCGAFASESVMPLKPSSRQQQLLVSHRHSPLMFNQIASLRFAIGRGGGSKELPSPTLLQRYSHLVDTKPVTTKAITAGTVAAMADIVTQAMVLHTPGGVSIRRVVAFLLAGALFVGPYLHVWYTFLDSLCRRFQSHQARTLSKMILDQSVGVTIFFPMYFMAYEFAYGLMHGQVPLVQNAVNKVRVDMWSIVLMNWRIWPLANLLNFGFVPQQLQVLFNQFLSFFWCIYISTRM